VYRSAAFEAGIAETRGYTRLAPDDPERIRQVLVARTLDLGVGTITGLGGWDLTAEQYIAESQMDERGATHVLAVVNAAVLDGMLGCWESKYTYFYIRPSQSDPTIQLVFANPNHPSYPSGHSCVSGAASTVLASFFPQHSADVENMKIQNGLSRLYAGIHYPFDVAAGQLLGSRVGAVALDYDRAPGGVLRRIP
jgi:membrane-associated phospholipid phosphatase